MFHRSLVQLLHHFCFNLFRFWASPPATRSAPAGTPAGSDQPGPTAVNSFPRAARENRRPTFDDTRTVTSTSTNVGPLDVAPFGYMRHIVLVCTASGAAAGMATVAAAGDAPWNILQNVQLIDVNGAPLTGPVTGYDLMLINKYGGYVANPTPTALPSYVAMDSDGDFRFKLRIPVEISGRDGLGALPNMTSSSTYKVQYQVAGSSTVYTTAPDTLGALRVEGTLESWTQPPPTDFAGVPNMREPIASGTTQFWTKHTFNVSSGSNRLQIKRTGNLIRNIIFVWRNTSGVRTSSNLPDPFILEYDGRNEDQVSTHILSDTMYERFGVSPDTGVIVYDYTHDLDGRPGFELRNGYLPTTQATDLNVIGTFGAAGILDVLVNDVAPVGGVFAG